MHKCFVGLGLSHIKQPSLSPKLQIYHHLLKHLDIPYSFAESNAIKTIY